MNESTGRVEMEELKPCPFCGSEDVGVSYGRKSNDMPFPYIECTLCAAMVAGEEDTELDARRAWNRRALESSLSRTQERLREIGKMAFQARFSKTCNCQTCQGFDDIHRLATSDAKPQEDKP